MKKSNNLKKEIEKKKKVEEDIDKKNTDIISKQKKLAEKEKELNKREKESDKKEKILNKRDQICKVQKSSFFSGILQSLIATILWTILVILIIKATEYDIIKFFTENQ